MASTPITGFPASAIPPPDDYVFVLADPAGVHLSANYKIRYGDLKTAFGGSPVWGAIGGVLSNQLDLQAALNAKADAAITISATAPLSGGGDLTANRSITTSMATGKLIGRGTAGVGVMEEITLGTNLSLAGTTLNASGGGGGLTTTAITINVASPVLWAQVVVIDATVNAASRINIFQGMTTELDMNDWIEGDVVFKATPGVGQFTVDLYTRDKSFLFGDYKLQYAVG